MSISSRQDWIDTARAIVPRLPDYMASISGQVDPGMVGGAFAASC